MSLEFLVVVMFVFVLMCRHPPVSTRTANPFPSTTLFRSPPSGAAGELRRPARRAGAARRLDGADDAFLAGALRRSRQSAGKDGSMTETDTRTVVVDRKSTRLNSSH